MTPFYDYPTNSTFFNIYAVDNLSNELTPVFIKDIKNKMMFLFYYLITKLNFSSVKKLSNKCLSNSNTLCVNYGNNLH